MNTLNNKLNKIFLDKRLTSAELQNLMNLYDIIKKIIVDLFNNCEVFLYGSIECGFSVKSSDLDMTVNFPENIQINKYKNINSVNKLNEIKEELEKQFNVILIKLIDKAKIPIINITINDILKCDISINNISGVHNTNFLKYYCKLDRKVLKLSVILKHLVKSNNINEAYKNTLSSYGYMIMLIHFLQKKKVLPVLHELCDDNSFPLENAKLRIWNQNNFKIIKENWKSCNDYSLEYLWMEFLNYYCSFPFHEQIITIRQSTILRKISKNWINDKIAIEDPFQSCTNVGYCVNQEGFNQIKDVFMNEYTRNLNSDYTLHRTISKNKIRRHIDSRDMDDLENTLRDIYKKYENPEDIFWIYYDTDSKIGQKNTKLKKLLKLLIDKYDEWILILAINLKHMTKTFNINDPQKGSISSYGYLIMLNHFLNKRKILACPSSKNILSQSVSNLWLDFFYYYTEEFRFDKHVVSIKHPNEMKKCEKGKKWKKSHVAIEDPFNVSINVSRRVKKKEFRKIKEKFKLVVEADGNPYNDDFEPYSDNPFNFYRSINSH